MIETVNIRREPLNDGWRFKIFQRVRDPKLPELTMGFDDSRWDKVDVQSPDGSLNEHEQAIYRAGLKLTTNDLTAQAIQLRIGSIDDDGWLYVNGRPAGESHGWNASTDFNIRPYLQKGDNTIAVAVVNRGGAGGLYRGASVEFINSTPQLQWQRSVFNGLGQILVQSMQNSGAIRLTASADGLTPSTVIIESQPPE